MAYVITDEDCFIDIKSDGVSIATIPKSEVVMVITLAGEPENSSGVDEVCIKHSGKYTARMPYTQITVGASAATSAEDGRTKILVYLNLDCC